MDQQQVSEELGQPGAQELLQSAPLLRLAYNGVDGLPWVIPIGFLWTGSRIVVCTSTTSPKVAALSGRPDVAGTVDMGDTPATARAVLVRGRATLETVDGIPAEYLEAATKTLEPEQVAGFTLQVTAMYTQMVRISIEPTWARFYDFGAGRLPATLQRLADNSATS